jgi:uncharacterized coiled-coil protein SlyX
MAHAGAGTCSSGTSQNGLKKRLNDIEKKISKQENYIKALYENVKIEQELKSKVTELTWKLSDLDKDLRSTFFEKLTESISKISSEIGITVCLNRLESMILINFEENPEYQELQKKLDDATQEHYAFFKENKNISSIYYKESFTLTELKNQKSTIMKQFEIVELKKKAFIYLNTFSVPTSISFNTLGKSIQNDLKKYFEIVTKGNIEGLCGTCFNEHLTVSVFNVCFCDEKCMNEWLKVYLDFLKLFKKCGLITYFVNYPADYFVVVPFSKIDSSMKKWIDMTVIPNKNVGLLTDIDYMHDSVFERVSSSEGDTDITPIEYLAYLYIKKRMEAESILKSVSMFKGFQVETGNVDFIKVSRMWKPVPYMKTNTMIYLLETEDNEDTFLEMFGYSDPEKPKETLYQLLKEQLEFGPGSLFAQKAEKSFLTKCGKK